jgi:hypothetical protein
MNQRYENYFAKALHDAKISELIETYSKNGYIAQKNVKTESSEFDLVVRNDSQDRTIAFEVKLLPLTKETRDAIEHLREDANRLGYEFRLVTIARPTRLSIDIEWLDNALFDYLIENTISDIDELATHVQYEDVEITVDAIHVTEDNATANVHGTIDVELRYGSNSDIANDIGFTTSYSVPFEGELQINLSSQTVDDASLRVDLSEWIDVGGE